MATPVFGSPLKKVYGETVNLTTTAAHLAVMPGYHEVLLYCASDWRWGLAPRLVHAVMFDGTNYTDYIQNVTDRVATTHMPLDGMTTSKYCYLGFDEPVRGVYFDMDGTNKNDVAATLDVEYCYDSADVTYKKITGTVSGAFTVGETVTGGTSAATGTLVYGPAGSTYIVVKNITGVFQTGETISGASETCSAVTAIERASTIAYFTDVAGDSDGTSASSKTLAQDGLYSWTLPGTGWKRSTLGTSLTPLFTPCYWIRFVPSTTLSATIDVIEIIPACDTVNYGYGFAGMAKQFSINMARVGAFEFDHAGADTLYVNWIMH